MYCLLYLCICVTVCYTYLVGDVLAASIAMLRASCVWLCVHRWYMQHDDRITGHFCLSVSLRQELWLAIGSSAGQMLSPSQDRQDVNLNCG